MIDRADPSGNRSRFSCAAVSDRKGVFELAESDGAEGSQLNTVETDWVMGSDGYWWYHDKEANEWWYKNAEGEIVQHK